jgi:hypothetical protein
VAVITNSYVNQHQISGSQDMWRWGGMPAVSSQGTFTAGLDAPLAQDLVVCLMTGDGSSVGSDVTCVTIPAGATTAPVTPTWDLGAQFPGSVCFAENPNVNWIGAPNITTTVTVVWTNAEAQTICAYGVSQKQPLTSIIEVSPGLLDIIGIEALGPWAIPIILAHSASIVALSTLCSGPPLPDPVINGADWTTLDPTTGLTIGVEKTLQKFQGTLWNTFCQCNGAPAGSPPPVAPTQINWTQPTSIVVNNNQTINENTLSTVINYLYQTIQGNQITTTNIYNSTGGTVSCGMTSYVLGDATPDLVGQGSVAMSANVGVLVQLTNPPDNMPTLPGNPEYLMNVGWLSFADANGMLCEKRMTREAMVWVPAEAVLATTFNYYLYPGAVITVTLLMPPTPPPPPPARRLSL